MEGGLHKLTCSSLPLGCAAPLTAETIAVKSRQPILNVSDFEKRRLAAFISDAGHDRFSKGQVHPRLAQPHEPTCVDARLLARPECLFEAPHRSFTSTLSSHTRPSV
jgi:hypothetical protein